MIVRTEMCWNELVFVAWERNERTESILESMIALDFCLVDALVYCNCWIFNTLPYYIAFQYGKPKSIQHNFNIEKKKVEQAGKAG